jgi:hypothetical protein
MLLVYRGLRPPHLFAFGDPGWIASLLPSVPSHEYQYALLPIHLSVLKDRLQVITRQRMRRMHLVDQDLLIAARKFVELLDGNSLGGIKKLYRINADVPEGFEEKQVEDGLFFWD